MFKKFKHLISLQFSVGLMDTVVSLILKIVVRYYYYHSEINNERKSHLEFKIRDLTLCYQQVYY